MSTRKSTQASPTAHGSKTENASASASSTANSTKPLVEKAEMGANVSSNGNNTNIANASETKHSQETKSFQQRVTRNSPLLLASPGSGISIKKEPIDPTEHQTNSESEEGSVNSIGTKKQIIRGRKSLKEHKETKEQEDKEKDEKQEEIEGKEKDKESKEEAHVNKINLEQKDSSPTQSQSQVSASIPSNRLTRKSIANQESANTRITRQRQSSGASVRSETPPAARARSGRVIGRNKMPVPMIDHTPVTKRKRSIDVDNNVTNNRKNSTDEPGPKYIKIEIKDSEIENEEMLTSSQATIASTDSAEEHPIKIKQEILDESENEMNTIAETNSTGSNNSTTINTSRGKGRWGPRKSTSTTTSASSNSPSTRATRQTKQSSPVRFGNASTGAVTESKKRRMGSQTRSLLKTSVSNFKNQSVNGQDEDDSKDSMASSTNTDDIVLALIKSEKISMELDDDNTNDAKDLLADSENHEEPKLATEVEENNDLPPPLIVDTDVTQTLETTNRELGDSSANLTPAAASCSSILSSGSEKAASLSPSELVSEGVSEISVKQFYKKPKFLENNLGIEEDPKLGNIVQKVAVKETVSTSCSPTLSLSVPLVSDTNTDNDGKENVTNSTADTRVQDESFSNESLKEGTLRFEESMDDKKSLTQDECDNSTGNLTPLLVVEDDDEGLDDVLEVKDDDEEENDETPKEESPRKNNNVIEDTTNEGKMKIVDDDVDAGDDDQDDELTLEESETISMDNNASINDEIVPEIEDNVNEDNTNELEDIADLTDAVITPVMQLNSEIEASQIDNNQTSINKSCDIVENIDATNINNQPVESLESDITVESAENDDIDVLAKIDAELRKIDERKKEKLLPNEEGEDILAPSKKEVTKFVFNAADIVCDNKLLTELDTKKDNTTIADGSVDVKMDDEKNLIINDDIKLLDDKEKINKVEKNPIDTLTIDKKSTVEKILLKVCILKFLCE